MLSKMTFKISVFYHPLSILLIIVALFLIGTYFDIEAFKNPLIVIIFLIVSFITSFNEKVVKVIFKDGKLEISTNKYWFKYKTYRVNINDIQFNYHYYDKANGKPLELYLIMDDGKVLEMTTKLWSKKTLIALSKDIFNVDVLKLSA
jgi:hypothetical protein